jgi:hypothetical protein
MEPLTPWWYPLVVAAGTCLVSTVSALMTHWIKKSTTTTMALVMQEALTKAKPVPPADDHAVVIKTEV